MTTPFRWQRRHSDQLFIGGTNAREPRKGDRVHTAMASCTRRLAHFACVQRTKRLNGVMERCGEALRRNEIVDACRWPTFPVGRETPCSRVEHRQTVYLRVCKRLRCCCCSVLCTNLFVTFILSADLILIYRMFRVINVKYLTVHSHIVAGAFNVQSECFVLTACRNP